MQLSYGGLVLQVVKTNKFDRQAVSSDDGVDYLYTKVTIGVTAYYSPSATSYFATGNPAQPFVAIPGIAPDQTDKIRHALLQKRGQLLYANGVSADGVGAGYSLICPAPGFNVDAHSGPNPLACNVTHIYGTRTWAVYFEIECCINECPGAILPSGGVVTPPALLSNRWEEIHDIDDKYFTTRTIRGRAKFRSDLLTTILPPADLITPALNSANQFVATTPSGSSASLQAAWHNLVDDYRYQIVPPVPPRFKRESIRIATSSDGTDLIYEVVDREQYLSLGNVANGVKFTAFQTVSNDPPTDGKSGGMYTFVNLMVRGEGNAQTAKWDIFVRCVQIALSRVNITADPAKKGQVLIQHFSYTEDLFNPFVELNVTFRTSAPTNQPGGAPINGELVDLLGRDTGKNVGKFGTVFTFDEVQNPLPPGDGRSRGTWLGLLAAAALSAPCASSATLPTCLPLSNPLPATEQCVPLITINTLGTLPAQPSQVSTLATQNIYTDYKIDVHYLSGTGKHVALVAAPSTAPAPNEVLDLAQPATTKVVIWTAECLGTWPLYPLTDTGDPNEVLVSERISPCAPQLSGDGQTYICRVSGIYVYKLKTPKRVGSALQTAALPTSTLSTIDTLLPGTLQQQENILKGVVGAPGQSPFGGSGGSGGTGGGFGAGPSQ